jgi:hypothetical protein
MGKVVDRGLNMRRRRSTAADAAAPQSAPAPRDSEISLDGEIKRRLENALRVVDDHGTHGGRLLADADRFCRRLRKFIATGLVPPETDPLPLDLTCYALQLPLKSRRAMHTGKTGRTSLRERSEAAAEMLVGLLGDLGHGALIEQTVAILSEVHQRHPTNEYAKLVADALNLEDFGVIGLVNQVIGIAGQGAGVVQVAEGMEKREQYGYWQARLKDGFHFDQVRQIARKRLENARRAAGLLAEEMKEDGGRE